MPSPCSPVFLNWWGWKSLFHLFSVRINEPGPSSLLITTLNSNLLTWLSVIVKVRYTFMGWLVIKIYILLCVQVTREFCKRKKLIGASLLLFYLNMTANCFIQCPNCKNGSMLPFLIREIATYSVHSFGVFFLPSHLLSICFLNWLVRRNCISIE
jgi:hypothetical protein